MTFLFEIIRLGLHNLRLHKLRSLLTSLGIIFGVAAVIFMVSIGEGNKQAALRNIEQLGATNIIMRSVKPPESTSIGSQMRGLVVEFGLKLTDYRRLRENFGDAAALVPLKNVGSEIWARAARDVSQVYGTEPELLNVTSLRLDTGRYITREDLNANAAVAVIGSEVARKLFRLADPLGETLRIDDRVFRVIGVLKPVGLAGGAGSALVGRDLNRDIHIPLTTARQMFGDTLISRQAGSISGERVELKEIYLTAPSTSIVTQMADRAERILQIGHPTMNDVQIIVPWELLEQAKREQRVWNIVLIAIASVSLLVGGIGIMNIMLASVTERTREIGIRRALGATRRHIISQFLVETGTLSTLGGVIGIGLGVGVSVLVERGLPWLLSLDFVRQFLAAEVEVETQITLWSIIISFLVAASIGLIFGIYPAIVASRKDPIVALRHD